MDCEVMSSALRLTAWSYLPTMLAVLVSPHVGVWLLTRHWAPKERPPARAFAVLASMLLAGILSIPSARPEVRWADVAPADAIAILVDADTIAKSRGCE